jgi:hypothetical protein
MRLGASARIFIDAVVQARRAQVLADFQPRQQAVGKFQGVVDLVERQILLGFGAGRRADVVGVQLDHQMTLRRGVDVVDLELVEITRDDAPAIQHEQPREHTRGQRDSSHRKRTDAISIVVRKLRSISGISHCSPSAQLRHGSPQRHVACSRDLMWPLNCTRKSRLHVGTRCIRYRAPNSAHGCLDVVLSQLVGNVTSRKAKLPCSLSLRSTSGSESSLNDRLFD